jgi:hypothetical protein
MLLWFQFLQLLMKDLSTFCIYVKRRLSSNLSFLLQFWKMWILMQLHIILFWIEIGSVDLMWPCVGGDEINYFTKLQLDFVEAFGHGSLTCCKHRIILTASLHDPARARSPVLLSLPLSLHIYMLVSCKSLWFTKWSMSAMNPFLLQTVPFLQMRNPWTLHESC